MREFIDEKDKEKYLTLCEEVFALAEDFNREEYIEEAIILKNAFREITEQLLEKLQQELNNNMNSRGL